MKNMLRWTLLSALCGMVCWTGSGVALGQQFRAPSKTSDIQRDAPVSRLRLTQQSENPIRREDNPRALPDSRTVPPPPSNSELRQPNSVDSGPSDLLDPLAPRRDPTNVRPELRPLLDPSEQETTQQGPVVVQLRGRISLGGEDTLAILLVGENLHLVREGTRINVGNPPKSLVVKKLTATHAEVELEYLDNRVIDLQ